MDIIIFYPQLQTASASSAIQVHSILVLTMALGSSFNLYGLYRYTNEDKLDYASGFIYTNFKKARVEANTWKNKTDSQNKIVELWRQRVDKKFSTLTYSEPEKIEWKRGQSRLGVRKKPAMKK